MRVCVCVCLVRVCVFVGEGVEADAHTCACTHELVRTDAQHALVCVCASMLWKALAQCPAGLFGPPPSPHALHPSGRRVRRTVASRCMRPPLKAVRISALVLAMRYVRLATW